VFCYGYKITLKFDQCTDSDRAQARYTSHLSGYVRTLFP